MTASRTAETGNHGGMTANDTLMQFQADILGIEVVRPKVIETTALGAAYAAGLAVDFWSSTQEVTDNWSEDRRFEPQMDNADSQLGCDYRPAWHLF